MALKRNDYELSLGGRHGPWVPSAVAVVQPSPLLQFGRKQLRFPGNLGKMWKLKLCF